MFFNSIKKKRSCSYLSKLFNKFAKLSIELINPGKIDQGN